MPRTPFSATDFKELRHQLDHWRWCQSGTIRLSQGRFGGCPKPGASPALRLEPHQLHLLLWNGDPSRAVAAPLWRAVPSVG